jgi:molybdopterin-guanine dinucleotide biosynthesis protein B
MILSVVGSPDSGKTTLIEKIVPILKKNGLKIVVVKHHAHGDFEFDRKGKDSWKFYESGADVVITSDKKTAMIKRTRNEYNLDIICKKYLSSYDLVLTEGFNRAGKDRIVVLNPDDDIERFKKGKILAVVCEKDVEGYKTYRHEQYEEIANLILRFLSSSLDSNF